MSNDVNLKELAAELLPGLIEGLKPIANAITPAPFVPVENAAIDAIDTWISHLLGNGTAPPNAPTAADAPARLADLERHVAALTLTTQAQGTSSLADLKAAAAKAAPSPPDATPTH